ncbi:MAG: TIGR04086 family membrane protein [Candidatus Carbobacillus sp.]|nr:TIGR04086 family membrane protein [Candidatus Carbobacillus sp.]
MSFNIWRLYLRSLGTMVAIVIGGSIVMSILIWSGLVREGHALPVTYGLHLVALMIGSFILGRNVPERGFWYGAGLGIGYALLLVLIGFLAFGLLPGLRVLLIMLLAVLVSALGGAIGLNSRS